MRRAFVGGLGLAGVLVLACGQAAGADPVVSGGADRESDQSVGVLSERTRAALASALDLSVDGADAEKVLRAAARPLGFEARAGSHEFTGELVVRALPGKVGRAMARVLPSVTRVSAFDEGFVCVKVPAGVGEGEMAAALMATGDYEYAEPNYLLYPTGTTPNDPQISSSWQHNRIQSRDAWDLHTGGSDVIVAVCDSGVDLDHPDLAASLVDGYNSASNQAQSSGGDVDDINGHGTFVAGLAAARGNNGTGVVGVGWDFSVMPIRVTNNTSGTALTFDISEGAVWAAENGAQIVNASFSGGWSASANSTARVVRRNGGLLFWSSGNDNAFRDFDGEDIVLVGSTRENDSRSGFSNFGPAVDVTAPGSSVRSTRRGGSYGDGSGTSYAAPVAAGVGAMIVSAGEGLGPLDVQDILYSSVDDLGPSGRDDDFGRGRVNTLTAVQMAQVYVPRLELPLVVDFEGAWSGVLSETSGDAVEVVSDETTALALGDGDAVESAALAGRTLNSGNGYFVMGVDVSGAPQGAALDVEILEASGVWSGVYSFGSLGLGAGGFREVIVDVPEAFFWHGTKVRVTASGGSFVVDDLGFDNLTFDEPVFPFVDGFDAAVVSPRSWWEREGGVAPAVVGSSYGVQIPGGASLESGDIATVFDPSGPYFVSLDVAGSAGIGADDVLYVDVTRDEDVPFTTVLEIRGDDVSGEPEQFFVEVTNQMLLTIAGRVRLRVEGDDAFLVDNVALATEVPSNDPCPADLDGSGALNFGDVSAFLALYGAGDAAADLDSSGTLNFGDVSAFLAAYAAGCP